MEPDNFYHIYNHANGKDNLFRSDENYVYFLQRYANFINPIVDTYAYCLMPNHFHFLLKIKGKEDIDKVYINLQGLKNNLGGPDENLGGFDPKIFISKQFSNFFNSYTKSFNKVYNRKGSLFQQNFKRKEVKEESYFAKIIHYIHTNPVHHGFVSNIEDWNYSSYNTLLSNKTTLLKRIETLDWFNGRDQFILYHKQPIDLKMDLE